MLWELIRIACVSLLWSQEEATLSVPYFVMSMLLHV